MQIAATEPVDTGKTFFRGTSGKWATEQLIKALKEGRTLSTSELRTCDTLRKDEWIQLDNALIEEATIRLQGVADLISAGNVVRLANGFGTTVYQWETMGDMDPAIVSMDGITRSENDRLEFSLASLPLPFTHKDFNINLRTLEASRKRGEGLDVRQARIAARVVAEKTEEMLFIGSKTFSGLPIYGYTTHPARNTTSFGAGGSWGGTKTGEQILADIMSMFAIMDADRMYGPYWIYISSSMDTYLNNDFKTASDKTIRQRLLETSRIENIRFSDKMPPNTVVMVQATPDVVQLVEGEPLQTIQWDVEGGFQINFKAFQILVPCIRADRAGRSGIVVMT
jgi:uncharacterized linocin/CFP29 family protein